MSLKYFCITLFLIFSFGFNYAQNFPIVINEVMSSNLNTIADEDGDYEDWIELHNRGEELVNLEGWGISDDDFNAFKWVFPDVTIDPDEYLIVWASGKDRKEGELHTNFSISSNGEPILLTHPEQGVIQFVPAVPIPGQTSYGFNPDQSGFFFYSKPTPGAPNTTTAYREILHAEPIFSHTGGFYTEPFELTITTDIPDAKIYYTLDGSEPDPDNLEGTTYQYKNSYPHGELLTREVRTYQYEEPLYIYDRSDEPYELAGINTRYQNAPLLPQENIFKGLPVRAIIHKGGALTVRPATHTYFITSEGRDRFDLPVISIVTDERNLFGYENGIYVAGEKSVDWYNLNPDNQWHWSVPANYHERGREWEKPAHLEAFYKGKDKFSQNMGIRIHGGATRSLRMKSFRLYARSAYDNADSFDFPFFPKLRAKGEPLQEINSFKRVLLRHSGNDSHLTLYRDALMQKLVKHLPITTQAYQPTVHFINGEFWGIINLRERYDGNYIYTHYNVNEEDVAILEAWASQDSGEPKDRAQFTTIRNYAENNDMNNPIHIEWLNQYVDLKSLLNYYAVQIYFNNTDWPQNNVKYWRKKTEHYNPNTPTGHDGRWRWMLYDTDFGMGLTGNYTNNSLARILDESTIDHASRLFKAILKNDTIRIDFINILADHLNSCFLPERIHEKINDYNNILTVAKEEHHSRWQSGNDIGETIKEFAQNRPNYLRSYIIEAFNLSPTYNISINRTGGGIVTVNSITLNKDLPGIPNPEKPYPWSGTYFQNVPITLKAIDQPGYKFAHWDGVPDSLRNIREIKIQPEENLSITAVFEDALFMETIHHWHFNNLDNEIHHKIPADSSRTEQQGIITYPGTGNGYLDMVSEGSSINITNKTLEGSALRVRNPSKDRKLIFQMPTTGYEEVVFNYAASRTSNGAEFQDIYYRTEENGEWMLIKDRNLIIEAYYLITVDFSEMEAVNNNPEFAVKITFTGENAENTSGNNRFDNVTLEGFPIQKDEEEQSTKLQDKSAINSLNIYPNPATNQINIVSAEIVNRISIMDMNGRNTLTTKPVSNKSNVDVSDVKAGIYLLLIETEFQLTTEKVFIKKH